MQLSFLLRFFISRFSLAARIPPAIFILLRVLVANSPSSNLTSSRTLAQNRSPPTTFNM